MDDLNILLKSKLDLKKSVDTINKQLKEMSGMLKGITLTLNLGTFEKDVENLIKKINKEAQKTKLYDSAQTKNEISKTIKDFSSLKKEIDDLVNKGFKRGKITTSFIDVGDGNKVKKIVEEYNDELNNSVVITQKISTQTGQLIEVEKRLVDNIKARATAEEKAAKAKEKSQETLNKQLRQFEIAKSKIESKLNGIAGSSKNMDYDQYNKLVSTLNKIDPAAKDAMLQLRELDESVRKFGLSAKEAGGQTNSFNDTLNKFTKFYGLYELFQLGERAVRSMADAVMELDASLLEVQKVAEIPSMDNFIKQAYETADSLKIVGTEFINGVADASRMGYALEEAFDMSEVANKMVIVGDGISSVEQAMGVLQSTLALFAKQGYNAQNILDILNETANNTGTSFGELAEMVSRSASVGLSGSSLESIVALNTTLFEVTRNAEASATAINMINQRLMGLDLETGEQSLELVSKLGEELKALTGVSVFDDNGKLKDTASILEEVAQKWSGLNKETQLMTATLIGNNRHAKSVSALMSNWDTYYKSLDASANSANSAQKELQAYLDSTTGKVEAMKGALQELFVTTLSSDLVGSIAEIATNVIKLTTELGGLVPVLNIIIGLVITLKANTISKWFVDAATSIGSTVKAMMTMATATKGATAATTAFGVASKAAFGWIGVGITAVSALIASINYMAGASKRSEENIKSLGEEIQQLSTDSDVAKKLAKEFEELKTLEKQRKLSNDEAQRFVDIQNQLKDLMPTISGYYDSNNNFIITETNLLKEVDEEYSEYIRLKKEERAEEYKNTFGQYESAYENEAIRLKDLNEELKKYQTYRDYINGKKISKEDELSFDEFQNIEQQASFYANGIEGLIKSTSESIKTMNNNMNQSLDAMQTRIIGIIGVSEEWDRLTKEQKDAISSFIAELGKDDITSYFDQLQKGTVTTDELVQQMSKLPEVQNLIAQATQETENAASSAEKAVKDSVVEMNKAAEQFNNISDKISVLSSISKELEENNGLSAESFKKLSSEFPKLLGYMNDEAALAGAIKEEMGTLSSAQESAYKQMLMNSQEYYTQNVLGNEQMIKSITTGINSLFTNLGMAYQGDLNNWKTLAQGRADIETQLISSLNKAWESHFGTLMTQFNKMANTPIATPQFNEGAYRDKLAKENPFMSKAQMDSNIAMARKLFNAQTQEYKGFQAEIVKRNQELSNMFKDINFDPVKINIGGAGSIGKGKGSSGSKGSSSKEFGQYYSQLIDEKIDVILSENERIEDAIAFAQEKLANAELRGDKEQQSALNKQILEFTQQQKDVAHKMAEELRKIGNDARIQLGNMNIKGYEGFNFSKLNDVDVSTILQSYDKAMVGASDKVKANIELQKSKFQELASVVMRIYGEEIPKLQSSWWSSDTSSIDMQIEAINRVAESEKEAYDNKIKQLELEQILHKESSDEYEAIEQEKLDSLLELQEMYMSKVRELKDLGLSAEQEDVKAYLEMYQQLEVERLNMIKQFAERRRQEEIRKNQASMEELRELQNGPQKLLDMVMSMLRQETEAKKRELEKQLENKKKAIEEEYNAEKKAVEDKLNLIRKEADARKEALRKEQDERNYNSGLEEKQKQIKDIENKILELSNDDSIQAIKKRKELEAELAKYKKDLEDYQYDHQLSIREDAINQELNKQEEKLNQELEKIDNKYKEELEMAEERYNQEVEMYEDMLSSQKKLRDKALDLIAKGERSLYDKLIKWNDTYGDGISTNITKAWGTAYEAMEKYGNGSNNVLDTIMAMNDEMDDLVRKAKDLELSSWQDYAGNVSIRPSGSTGSPNNSSSSKPSNDKYDGLEDKNDRAEYRDKQLRKLVALGDEMNRTPDANRDKIAKLKAEQEQIASTIGAYNQGGTWYIMINGKKYRVRDAIGVRHSGK